MSACCVGDASADFNLAGCVSDNISGETVPMTQLAPLFAGLNSTNVTLDQSAAQDCINGFASLSCGNNSSGTLAMLSATCSSALVAGLAAGGTGCLSTFDCPSGTYCGPITALDANYVPQVAAGGGTCLALLGLGDTCADDGYSTDCDNHSSLTGGVYCAANSMCESSKTSGNDCSDTEQGQECDSGQCVYNTVTTDYDCQPTSPFEYYLDSNECSVFAE